jgi:hypothetical protein
MLYDYLIEKGINSDSKECKKFINSDAPITWNLINEYTIENGELCPICMGDFSPDDKVYKHDKCSTKIHKECLIKTYELNETCPICRQSFGKRMSKRKSKRTSKRKSKRTSKRKSKRTLK